MYAVIRLQSLSPPDNSNKNNVKKHTIITWLKPNFIEYFMKLSQKKRPSYYYSSSNSNIWCYKSVPALKVFISFENNRVICCNVMQCSLKGGAELGSIPK
jgi:hypothetical protein